MFKLFSMMAILTASMVAQLSAAPKETPEKDKSVEQAEKKTKSEEQSDEENVILTPEAFSDVTDPSAIESKELSDAPITS